jgi:hypothetical protein
MRVRPLTSRRGTGIEERGIRALARVADVLLNAPYASALRLFELRGPPLPYRLILNDQFDSEALIGSIGVPVMILHGTADESVPVPRQGAFMPLRTSRTRRPSRTACRLRHGTH